MFFLLCLLVVVSSCSGGPSFMVSGATKDGDKARLGSDPVDTGGWGGGGGMLGHVGDAAGTYLPHHLHHTGGEGGGWRVVEEATRGVFPGSLWHAFTHPSHVTPHQAGARDDGRMGLLDSVRKFYLPNLNNVSKDCRNDVTFFLEELVNRQEWAIRMVDSWGKFPDGVLGGNTWVPGHLYECVGVRANNTNTSGQFQGRYCAMTYRKVQGTSYSSSQTMRQRDVPNLKMAAITGQAGLAIYQNVYATCIPSSCTEEEMRVSLTANLQPQGLALQFLGCQTSELPGLEYTARDVTMIVVLSVLSLLCLAGTVLDVFLECTGEEKPKTGMRACVLAFSLYTNIEKIFRINTQEGEEIISCLHGIRVMTMSWVVLGHTYIMANMNAANKAVMPKYVQSHLFSMQVLLNGLLSVDSFFFMSGLLVAYNLTKEFQRTKKFNIPVYYIHRFIRLAPAIMLLCGFYAVFPPLFTRGTQAPTMVDEGSIVDLCRRYWWRDSFFLTNWFFNEFDTESCIPVCWYTAVEFQLYIVTPLMFLPILYRRKIGAIWLGCCIFGSVLVTAIITGVNELPPTQVQDISFEDYVFYTKWVYTKPYCRAQPYLVGLALGYFFRVTKKQDLKLKTWQVVVGWVLAVLLCSLVVFGIQDYNTMSGQPAPYNAAVSITYSSLHRLAWGVAMAWIVFACHRGYGGPINSLLAHPGWQPISRLTYCIFLCALNLQFLIYLYMTKFPTDFTNFNKVIETVGIIFISGIGGLMLSLLSEAPVLGLEKVILKRGGK